MTNYVWNFFPSVHACILKHAFSSLDSSPNNCNTHFCRNLLCFNALKERKFLLDPPTVVVVFYDQLCLGLLQFCTCVLKHAFSSLDSSPNNFNTWHFCRKLLRFNTLNERKFLLDPPTLAVVFYVQLRLRFLHFYTWALKHAFLSLDSSSNCNTHFCRDLLHFNALKERKFLFDPPTVVVVFYD